MKCFFFLKIRKKMNGWGKVKKVEKVKNFENIFDISKNSRKSKKKCKFRNVEIIISSSFT
jgi:hypothetical protein